ncbi:hypothetical protein BYT27DRAFT_7262522 [Phlegmacium glaucopus]|nr:hypothetical protein BYT27DRAFT_7262522 [Phlegmacium glaucopus]
MPCPGVTFQGPLGEVVYDDRFVMGLGLGLGLVRDFHSSDVDVADGVWVLFSTQHASCNVSRSIWKCSAFLTSDDLHVFSSGPCLFSEPTSLFSPSLTTGLLGHPSYSVLLGVLGRLKQFTITDTTLSGQSRTGSQARPWSLAQAPRPWSLAQARPWSLTQHKVQPQCREFSEYIVQKLQPAPVPQVGRHLDYEGVSELHILYGPTTLGDKKVPLVIARVSD